MFDAAGSCTKITSQPGSPFFLSLIRCVLWFPVVQYEYMCHTLVSARNRRLNCTHFEKRHLFSFAPTVHGSLLLFSRLPWISIWKAFVVGLIASDVVVVVVIFSWCVQISVTHVGRSAVFLRIIYFFPICLRAVVADIERHKIHKAQTLSRSLSALICIHSAAALVSRDERTRIR